MSVPLRAAFSRERLLAWLVPALSLALGLFAYRPLYLGALRLPAGHEVERWFFGTGQFSPLLVLGIAGWLVLRRRQRLFALAARSDPGTTAALIAVASALFLWAQLTRAAPLLLPSLAAALLAAASASRGRPGCRVLLLPAVVLLLGLEVPAPLLNELVWQLQVWSAQGAGWMLQSLGLDVTRTGVLLERGEYRFLVIEECSGLRGIQTLTLVALLIRELFAASGARQWLLVAGAPFLGFALNVARVVAVASSPQAAEAAADHTLQGLAVVIAGTAILYALGFGLAARGGRRAEAGLQLGERCEPAAPTGAWKAAAWLAVLALISVAVPPFARAKSADAAGIEFPQSRSGWSSEPLTPDFLFVGALDRFLYRRYTRESRNRPPEVVELFVAFELPGEDRTTRLFSPKSALPGSDWSLQESRSARLWTLDRDAELAVAARDSGSELAVVYSWRVRDEGLWRETWRSLLALEASPFRRDGRRAVVRLATPLAHGGPVARERAKRQLDRFVTSFRDELDAL